MRNIISFLVLLIFTLTSCGQKYQYPGLLEFKTFKIGDKVDTTLFNKKGNLYFPNYLDGWTMDNFDNLPEKYQGLPIGIWMLKSDSSVALTLLNDIILNITVSYLTDTEKNNIIATLNQKFGADGKQKYYEEKHPLQTWITYWNLKTWETKNVIVQIGNSDMRKPHDPIPTKMLWNLAYSDFLIENKIIDDFKKTLFTNKEDSLKYLEQLNTRNNKMNPPRNGVYTDYYENGTIKEKGIYKNGKKNGVWEQWYENGQKMDSASYKNDELELIRLMWHDNGQLMLESEWGKFPSKKGKWIRYYKDGQIETITNYDAKGQLHGIHIQYYENGNKKREVIYDRGNVIEDTKYDEQGYQLK